MRDNHDHDVVKDHQYDGIQEYDNQLPRWWLTTFFITIVFGAGYWAYYHVSGRGPNQTQEYTALIAEAAKKSAAREGQEVPFDEAEMTRFLAKPEVIAEAKAIFKTNCAACHGAEAQGAIGPNLTDAYWIHGGKPAEIYHTIEIGVAAKGMPKWHGILGSEQIRKLVAYLQSLQGSAPSNAKAPEGNPL